MQIHNSRNLFNPYKKITRIVFYNEKQINIGHPVLEQNFVRSDIQNKIGTF